MKKDLGVITNLFRCSLQQCKEQLAMKNSTPHPRKKEGKNLIYDQMGLKNRICEK